MKKVICSRQVLAFKKPLRSILASSLSLALLLPISALAAEDVDDSNAEVRVSDPFSDLKDKETIQSNKPEISDDKVVVVPTDIATNSDTAMDDNKSPTSAADAYISQEKAEKPSAAQPKVADKNPSWMSFKYLLGGGLLLLLLGIGFLLLRKIDNLNDENEELLNENSALKKQVNTSSAQLKMSKEHNTKLKSAIERLNNMLGEQQSNPVNVNTDASDLSSMRFVDTQQAIVIEDLDKSDYSQLAIIFDNWLTTNRGNTKVDDLIPEHIKKKIKHWHYTIELWGQGSGLDSVETTKNTMHTAVISLIKNDNKGYAYCYKKPNSMSSAWENKAWYRVEKTNGTLKPTGEPLETN